MVSFDQFNFTPIDSLASAASDPMAAHTGRHTSRFSMPSSHIDPLSDETNDKSHIVPEGAAPRRAFPAEIPDSQEELESPDEFDQQTNPFDSRHRLDRYGVGYGDSVIQVPNSQPVSSDNPTFSGSLEARLAAFDVYERNILRNKYPLHTNGFFFNGRLPSDAPQNQHLTSMEEQLTQPATQPMADPRLFGRNGSGLSEQDLTDVICLLHPASIPAVKAVNVLSRSTPQHILQNDGLSMYFADEDCPVVGMKPNVDDEPSRDIALRMSSKLINPAMGFCFGRNTERSDIVIGGTTGDTLSRVSNVHFRIYLNENGVIMLHDMSTNGTVVDGVLLIGKRKPGTPRYQETRMLDHASQIQLITKDPHEEIKFIVRLPSRYGRNYEYAARLQAYITEIERHQQARDEQIQQKRVQKGRQISKDVYPAASSHRTYMRWDGGHIYNILEVIGSGSFASVWKIATKDKGEVFACKELDKRKFMKNGVLDIKVDNEMKIMKRLRHPNIVQYIDYVEIDTHVYIIMEYVPFGDLREYLSRHHTAIPMPEYLAQSMSRQILQAMEYLHAQKITHRDIKPDNILISKQDPFEVKLSDFGLSKVVENETFLKTFCGTLLYCAPEVFPAYQEYVAGRPMTRRRAAENPAPKYHAYSSSVDVWSYGAVLFYALTTMNAFQGTTAEQGRVMLENIMKQGVNVKAMQQKDVTEAGIDFVSKMLTPNPEKRPTETTLLTHPWLVGLPDEVGMEQDRIIEEEEQLGAKASQLSLQGTYESQSEDEMDTTPLVQDEEVTAGGQQKLDIHRGPEPGGPFTAGPDAQRAHTRLFGEISAPALQSSGVLGHTTLQDFDGPPRIRIEDSGNSNTSSLALDPAKQSGLPNKMSDLINQAQQRQAGTHDKPSLKRVSSLEGADSMVRQLHMSSTRMAPNNPGQSKDVDSLFVAGMITSAPQDGGNDTTDEPRPKRVKSDRRIQLHVPASHYWDPADVTTHTLEYASKVSGYDYVAEAKSKALAEAKAVYEASRSAGLSVGKESHLLEKDGEQETEGRQQLGNIQVNASSISTAQDCNGIAGGVDSNKTTNVNNENAFVRPRPILGKLVSLPGSFADYSIKIDSRITTFGRSLGATVRVTDTNETRISREALEIRFIGPGVLTAEAEGKDWKGASEAITAVLRAPSKNIYVNGVLLPGGQHDGGWSYGTIHTGDVVELYKDPKATGVFLRFKCEFFLGKSKKGREPDEPRFVVEFEPADWDTRISAKHSALPLKQSEGAVSDFICSIHHSDEQVKDSSRRRACAMAKRLGY